ncbi:FHA domain-containing protein [bacterium D16-51]|nr:FHA domain-containing protein [bacterium D16-59]RKI62108.1 FHA domain-containing protein [bacterium D16-51]
MDEKNCQVIWKTSAVQAQSAVLGWRMLEHNDIPGILPFDYYYADDQICFRCFYAPFERISSYFQKNSGDFKCISSICEGVLKILEQGDEYLLGREGYLLLPEWIFWNRYEGKIAVCYFPGRQETAQKEYISLVEYLMQHTDHSDKKAVTWIYNLYDMIVSGEFIIENLLQCLQKEENCGKIYAERIEETGNPQKAESTNRTEVENIFLKPVENCNAGKIRRWITEKQGAGICLKEGKEILVGRREGSGIYLPFDEISRKHAVFLYEGGKLCLMDLSSKNGTYLNGKKISAYAKTQCRENDVVTFADISCQIKIHRGCQ